jgi:hypothetical protein
MGAKADRKHADADRRKHGDAPDDVELPDGRSDEDLPGPRRRGRVARYAGVMAVYSAGVAGATVAVRRRGVPERLPGWSDLALVGLATHKLSRLLTKEVVTTPLRAPFTEVTGRGGPAEVNERPIGDGWRHSLGELLSCPFCAGVWIATGLTAGTFLAPVATRAVTTTFGAVAVSDFLQVAYTFGHQHAE